MAHTPGPWEVRGGSAMLHNVVGGRKLMKFDRQQVEASIRVCRVHRHADGDDNLRLICAAPDLLAACRSLFDEDGCWKPGLKLTGEQHVLFEVAMKKAVSK